VVGTVARLQEERKGISDFIAMAGRVSAQRPRARFLVVGDGPLREALERQSQQLGLSGKTIFTGYRADVPRMLSAMDVAVFPSSYEAAQYVMLEAMAAGRPVVLTPAGLAIDIVQPGITGMLVPVHDVAGLAVAVENLLDDRENAARMGAAARQVIVEHYSTDAMVTALTGLYAEVTDGRSRLRAAPANAVDLR
jgi:glycosyltransferase involved in cell wall biosynthesis